MNINLPTGKVISVSAYEYYFILKDEDLDEFFQSCIADDLGNYIENPFSNKCLEKLEVKEEHEEEE